MKLRYTVRAHQQIEAIIEYIAEQDPTAAVRVAARIRAAADRLRQFPHTGHVGSVIGTFEWVVRGLPYILVFEVDPDRDEVIILGVFHGAQDRGSVS